MEVLNQTAYLYLTLESDVHPPEAYMQAHFCFNLLVSEGLVLGVDVNCVRLPPIAEVAHQYDCTYPQRNAHSQHSPQSLQQRGQQSYRGLTLID